MTVLYLILNIVALVLIVLFVIGIVKSINNNNTKPSVKAFSLKGIGLILSFVIVPVLFVNYFVSEPVLESNEQKVEFYTKYKYYISLNHVYYDMLQEDASDPELHFKYVNTIVQFINSLDINESIDLKNFEGINSSKKLIAYYSDLKSRDDSVSRNYGLLFLGLHYINLTDNTPALVLLDSINNPETPYYHFVRGKYYARSGEIENYQKADSLLNLAILDSVGKSPAYNELAFLYYSFGKEDELKALVKDPAAFDMLGLYPKRIVFLRDFSVVNYWKAIFKAEFDRISFWGFISSLFILMIWLFYLRRIDVYEKENWLYILLTLFLGMGFTYLVYPIHDIISDQIGYFSSSNVYKDFLYDIISIGAVEELVKIIPVLIILRFSKAINEPFDYILYSSVSALGFAFIENLGYIQESSLYNINARAFMSTMAHIVFSSTVGYGLMLAKYKNRGNSLIYFIVFFSLAAIMHGFYDFWLMNEWARNYQWVTFVFFIISIHFWHVYANNTLNITTFYDPKIKMQNDNLKIYLIASLVGVFMFSYLINAITKGGESASGFLLRSWLVYGFFILYLAFSLSKFQIIRGYFSPFSVPLNLLIPRVKRVTNFSGMPVKLSAAKKHFFIEKFSDLRYQLPVTGVLGKRIVIDNHPEGYVVKLDDPLKVESYISEYVVIMPKNKSINLSKSGNILVYFMLIKSLESLEKPWLTFHDFVFIGWVISKRIDESDKN